MSAANDLPLEFFVRLIWQESRFDPSAVSQMGAIRYRAIHARDGRDKSRLTNALRAVAGATRSASYLRELRVTFGGNLGLAKWPPYNAGPGAVSTWRAGPSRFAVRDAGICSPGYWLLGRGPDGTADAGDDVRRHR